MLRGLRALALAGLLSLVLASPALAAGHRQEGPPKIAARAWILEDATTGQVLAGHRPTRRLPIASTTKLMTAHLALEHLPLAREITAPAYHAIPGESIIDLRRGERMTARDLLYALVLASANDAAVTLADGVSGAQPRFVRLMNATALALGLTHTHYSNPVGLDEPGNYSSASDLVTLARLLLRNRTFRHVADSRKAVLRSGDHTRRITTRNTLLLEDPSATGVKTGHTVDAGYVLVGSAERRGVSLIAAVLGAPSEPARDADTERLLDYGFARYHLRMPVRRGQTLAAPRLRYRDSSLPLIAADAIRLGVLRGQRIATRVQAPREVDGPIHAGERLGRVTVTVDGRGAISSPLIASRAASAASFVDKARDKLDNPLLLLLVGCFVILIGLVLARRGRRPPNAGPKRGSPDPQERARRREERMKRRNQRRERRARS